MQEVNTFYLKAILWYPPDHMINVIREIIYGFGGACATHEVYEYLSTKCVETVVTYCSYMYSYVECCWFWMCRN